MDINDKLMERNYGGEINNQLVCLVMCFRLMVVTRERSYLILVLPEALGRVGGKAIGSIKKSRNDL